MKGATDVVNRFGRLLLLVGVFVSTVLISLLYQPDQLFARLAQYPAIASLLAILWWIIQQEIREQRDLRLAESHALNSLFAGSHYAARIYDRQLEFCEDYWTRVLGIVKRLERDSVTAEIIPEANGLYTFRAERAIWLTRDVNEKLQEFEDALRHLGARHVRLESIPVGPERTEMVETSVAEFCRVMKIPTDSAEGDRVPSYRDVLLQLQGVLGIAEAYEFRQKMGGRVGGKAAYGKDARSSD